MGVWIDRRIDGWIFEQMEDGQEVDGWIDGWILDRWTDRWMDIGLATTSPRLTIFQVLLLSLAKNYQEF